MASTGTVCTEADDFIKHDVGDSRLRKVKVAATYRRKRDTGHVIFGRQFKAVSHQRPKTLQHQRRHQVNISHACINTKKKTRPKIPTQITPEFAIILQFHKQTVIYSKGTSNWGISGIFWHFMLHKHDTRVAQHVFDSCFLTTM